MKNCSGRNVLAGQARNCPVICDIFLMDISVIVLVFLLGTAAYYYQEWLKTFPKFSLCCHYGCFHRFLLTYSPILTFMSEADSIFLIPLETTLDGYFKKSIIISFTLQTYLLVMSLAVLMPLYATVNNGNFKSFFYFLAAVIVVKYVNLMVRWHVQYYQEETILKTDSMIRFCVNLVFLYLLFSNAAIYFDCAIYYFIGLIFVL